MTTPSLPDIEDELHQRLSAEVESEMLSGALSGVPDRDDLHRRAERLVGREPQVLTRAQQAALVRS